MSSEGKPCAYTPYCSARESRNASCTHSRHSYHECPSPCSTSGPKSSRETTALHRHSILYIEGHARQFACASQQGEVAALCRAPPGDGLVLHPCARATRGGDAPLSISLAWAGLLDTGSWFLLVSWFQGVMVSAWMLASFCTTQIEVRRCLWCCPWSFCV